jgi:hemoglobin
MTEQSTEQSVTETPYTRLGGSEPVRAVVQRFYERVLADPALAPYFEGVDMTVQRRHFALLVVQLLGGPSEYAGRELGDAHRGLHVSDDAYDKVVAHLVATLQEAGVPGDIIAGIGQTATDVRPAIVDDGVAASV